MATTIERKPVSIRKADAPSSLFVWLHRVGLSMVGTGILTLLVMNVRPYFQGVDETKDQKAPQAVPQPDWRRMATQHGGRFKPLQTAAADLMRDIHGRSTLDGQEASAVVLMWMFENDPDEVGAKSKWDDYPFILCEHRDFRKFLYSLNAKGKVENKELDRGQLYGKYISPNDLTAFRKNFDHLEEIHRAEWAKYRTEHSKPFGEAMHRLELYQHVRKQFMPKDKIGEYVPFVAFVALDKVKGTPWFSIDELRLLKRHPDTWFAILKQRINKTPQYYLSPEHQKALKEFQQQVERGAGVAAVEALNEPLKEQRQQVIANYKKLRGDKKNEEADELIIHAIRTWPASKDKEAVQKKFQELMPLLDREKNPERDLSKDVATLQQFLEERDAFRLENLTEQVREANDYSASLPEWQMLHMSYLETRFPNLYKDLIDWQKRPGDDVNAVLAKYDAAGKAYRSGDGDKFNKASEEFFTTVAKVSEKVSTYPGEDTIGDRFGHLLAGTPVGAPSRPVLDLELSFNRARPFMWAWILMLLALVMFVVSLALQSRIWYILGYVGFAVSLCFQVFGFFTRTMISGRPPVTNMYETVIWVAFMSSIFALILEMIYRRKVIAVAGALVATIGLVLADQLPLALNPKIDPLVPVLRSNFWLTIHVLTIVSSYAAGTLAWGLGNISLILILFSDKSRDTIKVLSNFTYRALQIAVILLAIGTFLGGWWAAYSWGRFWGWDAKENGALIALLCYVIPLHMRYIGWVKDFGLAVAAILCYAAILISWYGVNFLWPAGLHSYGFSGGGAGWVYMACLINIEWVLAASLMYKYKLTKQSTTLT